MAQQRDATDDGQIEFKEVGGLNERPNNASLPPPDFGLVHGLYMSEAGSLTRLPGTDFIARLPAGVLQVQQLNDGTGNVVVQTDDGNETLFTLAEIFDREGDTSDIVIDGQGPGTSEDSFPAALIVHEEAQGTDGGAIGTSLNTWYGWKLTGNPVNESTIVTTFRDYDNGAVTFTVTVATPAIFTKAAHGLAAGDRLQFSTSGALPTGLTVGVTYYVIAAGLTADDFEVSTTLGGTAVNTTGGQSGVHTMYVNPSTFDLAAGTYRVEAYAVVNASYNVLNNDLLTCTIPVASPAIVTNIAHGLSAGDGVTFNNGVGFTLPAPLVKGTVYYVSATDLAADTFKFSATPGGSLINVTAVGNGYIQLYPVPKNATSVAAIYNETDASVVGVFQPVVMNDTNQSFGGNPNFPQSRNSNLVCNSIFEIGGTKRFSIQVAGASDSGTPWTAATNSRGETHGVTTSLGGAAVVNRYLALKITKENA